jgi:hypothetical protein
MIWMIIGGITGGVMNAPGPDNGMPSGLRPAA